jgi:carbamate kinase
MTNARRIVLALGGNALIRPGEQGTIRQQFQRVREVTEHIAYIAGGCELVITHGNGPHVGRHLLRSDLLRDQIPTTPFDVAVAATQGEIGFLIQQSLQNAFRKNSTPRPVVTLLTQIVVDENDRAFLEPTKFVGRFMSKDRALQRAGTYGWQVKQDGDRGWRRVVPSPQPIRIVEADSIRRLVRTGAVVVACGGGGIPVLEREGILTGVEAVIDKDLASALLANRISAEVLILLTGVERVMTGFGTAQEKSVDAIATDEARALLAAGEFPPGSMGPKIEAALRFLDGGGSEVLITLPERLSDGMAGLTGTRIVR